MSFNSNTVLIDSHVHVDDNRLMPDRDSVLDAARNNNIGAQIVPAVSRQHWPRLKALCDANEDLHPCYGLHPAYYAEHTENHLLELPKWLGKEPAVAVGECGLDYAIAGADKAHQQHLFAAQLALAREFNLPIVIHAVKAVEDVIRMIRASGHYRLLGGLLIHGIFPGSDLFENHPQVAWTFINSMLIGQVLMVIFGIWIASYAARTAQVPKSIMAACVAVLALFGSYSVQQSMGDVYIMATLGIAMYFLEKFGFSAAPLVLGLILGPIAESNFIQGSMIANATDGVAPYFLMGPLNLLLIGLVVASIAYSFVMSRRLQSQDSTHSDNEQVSAL